MSFSRSCSSCAMMIWPVSINLPSSAGMKQVLQEWLWNGQLSQSLSISQHSCRMGRKSPSPSWLPRRLLRCCCELVSRVRALPAEVQAKVLVGISIGAIIVGIPSSRRGSRVGPGIRESISASKFHLVPRASIVSRRLRLSPGGFLRTDLHLSKPCFVPTRCSSDDASRPHQQPLIHLFVSLAARTS